MAAPIAPHDSDGGHLEKHALICAGKAAQEKGTAAGDEVALTSKAHSHTRAAEYRGKVPSAVGLLIHSTVAPLSPVLQVDCFRISDSC